MARYGYWPSAQPADWGTTGTLTSNLRAYRPDRMSENGWAYQMQLYAGKRSGQPSPTVSLAVYASDNSLYARTDSFEPQTVMEDIASGTVYTKDLR